MRLTAGQNCPLPQPRLRFEFGGAGSAAVLLVNDRRQVSAAEHFVTAPTAHQVSGITTVDSTTIDADLAQLPPGVERVLMLVNNTQRSALHTRIRSGGTTIAFGVDATAVHPVTLCFEVYLRSGAWRVRAVGQGYAGGVTELAQTYAFTPPDRAAARRPPPPAPPPPAPPSPVTPLGDGDPLERITMIYEDAARITAAASAAIDFAQSRRDDELSAAVADAATRNTPAAQHAINSAQTRHDQLVARATADYHRDASHLTAELHALDGELPPSLSSWESAAWHETQLRPSHGIRLGTATVPELGPLQVPICTAAPLRRPLWFDVESAPHAWPAVAAAIMRLLTAAPGPHPTLDIIDVGGTLQPVYQPLTAHLVRPIVSDIGNVAARLRTLAEHADLTALRRQVDHLTPHGGVVVIADVEYATPPTAFADLLTLINKAAEANLSVVLTGDHINDATTAPLIRNLCEYSLHMPSVDGTAITDPWTQHPWQFCPDHISLDTLIGLSAALVGRHSGRLS